MDKIGAGWQVAIRRMLIDTAGSVSPLSAGLRRKPGRARGPLMIALEPRYLFDGAGAASVVDAAHHVNVNVTAPPDTTPDPLAQALSSHVLSEDTTAGVAAPTQVRAADSGKDGGKKEVAFVDSSAPGYQALVDGVRAGVEVEVIDSGQSGLAQMALWAESHGGYDAIHLISHGTEANLRVGTDSVTSDSLNTDVGRAEMAALGSALKTGGDILIYGCDVAKGADGQQLVAGIAAATGADVAASTDRTGAAAMGGDWTLESATGAIATPLALTAEAQAAYDRVLAPAHEAATADQLALIPDVTAPTPVRAADPSLNNGQREVVFIDTSVGDYQTLVDGIRAGVEIELIDGGHSGFAQMALWAESHIGYDAIHVMSHGSPGTLRLGTDAVTDASLSTAVSRAELAEIGHALNAGGDLLFYGCDVAKGSDGRQFVADLASATSADIAASTDVTGLAARGANWSLESTTGSVSTLSPFVNGLPAHYDHILASLMVTTNSDSGANATIDTDYDTDAADGGGLSLREALNYAGNGDTITFASGYTITIGSDLSVAAGVTLNADISAGTSDTVTIDGSHTLTLAGGLTVSNGTGDTLAIGTVAAGAGGAITKTGAGTLTLSGANTYSGATTLSAGILVAANATALGDTAGGTTVNSGATLQFSGGVTIAENIVLDTASGTAVLESIIGNNTLSGTITHASQGAVAVSAAVGTTLTISGMIAGGGNGDGSSYDLHFGTTTDTGTVILSGANSFKDAVSLNYGTLTLANAAALGTTDKGIDEMDQGTVLALRDVTITGEDITDFWGGTIQNLSGDNTFAGAIKKPFGDVGVDVATGTTLTLSGAIGSDVAAITDGAMFGLSKAGAGTLVLTGTNHYNGSTTISEGTLRVAGDANLGATWIQNDGGTITSNVGGAIRLAGGTLAVTGIGGQTVDNAIILVAGGGTISYANTGGSDLLTLSGVISGIGNILTKTGAGAVLVNNNVNHTGWGVTITAGRFAITNATCFGTGTVTLNGGTFVENVTLANEFVIGSGGGLIDCSSTSTLSGTITGSGLLTTTGAVYYGGNSSDFTGAFSVSSGEMRILSAATFNSCSITLAASTTLSVQGTKTLGNTITLAGNATLATVGAAVATFTGTISESGGARNLTVTGSNNAGKIILSGDNTYTGVTTVSVGTLVASHNNALGTTAGATTVTSGATLEIASGITSAENLTLAGTGVSSAGALSLTSGTGTVTGAVAMSANSTIVVAGTSLTLSGVLSGGFALTKTGSGSLTLSGSNTYTGATTVSVGTLVASHTNALGTTAGATTVTSGATLEIASGIVTAESLTLAGTGVSSRGALSLTSGNGKVIGTVAMSANSTISVTGTSLTLSGVLSGGFALTKSGSGSLTLSNANTYTGLTTVSAGTLVAANATALGTTAGGVSIADGATLALQGGITVGDAITSVQGTGVSGGGALINVSGTNTISGTVSLALDTTIRATAGTLTLSGAVTGNGKALTKAGAGVLTLSSTSNNSSTFSTIITAGTLSIAGQSRIGSGTITLDGGTLSGFTAGTTSADGTGSGLYNVLTNAVVIGGGTISPGNGIVLALKGALTGSGALAVTGGGDLDFWNADGFTGDMNVSSGTWMTAFGTSGFGTGNAITLGASNRVSVSGGTRTISSNFVLAGDATLATDTATNLTANGAIITFSGTISETGGSHGLTLINTDSANNNTLRITGTNTYSGTTTVFNNSKASVATDSNMGGGTGLVLNTGSTLVITGSNTITKTITGGSATIEVGGSLAVELSGVIGGNTGRTLTKTGTGTLTLSNANTYTGLTTVSAGTLVAANATALGTTAGGVSIADGATLALQGGITVGDAITSVQGTGVSGGGALVNVSGANTISGTVALAGDATVTVASNSSLTLSNTVSGTSRSLTKTGTGTLTLSGVNTYTGATTVSAGNLQLTGSIAGAVTVGNSGTLVGTGRVTGLVSVQSGGGISPGNSGTGTLTLNGGLTVASGGTVALDINGTNAGSGYDVLAVTGAVSIDSAATLTLSGSYTPSTTDRFILITNDSTDAITGAFSGLASGENKTFNTKSLAASYSSGTGNDFALGHYPKVVSIVRASSAAQGTNAASVSYTVTFSEAVTGVDAGDLVVTATTGSNTGYSIGTPSSSDGGITWTVPVATSGNGAGNATIRLDLNDASDASGITSTTDGIPLLSSTGTADGSYSGGETYIVDKTPPTLAITSDVAVVKAGETATITFTFSEDPGSSFTWNGTTGDVAVSGGTLGAISGSGLTRTATFTPTAALASGSASVTVASGAYTDAAGNSGGAGSTPSIAIDTLAPTLTAVSVASSNATPTLAKVGDIITVSFTTDGSQSGSPTATIDGHAATVSRVSGNAYTATYTMASGDSEGAVTFALNAVDAAGNVMSPVTADISSSSAVTFDKTSPVAPGVSLSSDTGWSRTDAITSTGTLSLTGIEDGATVQYSTNRGSTWQSSFTASAGSRVVEVRQVDNAGNIGNASTLSFVLETQAPTSISGSLAAVNAAAVGTSVGTVSATDPAGQAMHYTLVNDGGHFAIDQTTGKVTISSAIDYSFASATRYTITVQVEDAAGLSSTKTFDVSVSLSPAPPPPAPPAPPVVEIKISQLTTTPTSTTVSSTSSVSTSGDVGLGANSSNSVSVGGTSTSANSSNGQRSITADSTGGGSVGGSGNQVLSVSNMGGVSGGSAGASGSGNQVLTINNMGGATTGGSSGSAGLSGSSLGGGASFSASSSGSFGSSSGSSFSGTSGSFSTGSGAGGLSGPGSSSSGPSSSSGFSTGPGSSSSRGSGPSSSPGASTGNSSAGASAGGTTGGDTGSTTTRGGDSGTGGTGGRNSSSGTGEGQSGDRGQGQDQTRNQSPEQQNQNRNQTPEQQGQARTQGQNRGQGQSGDHGNTRGGDTNTTPGTGGETAPATGTTVPDLGPRTFLFDEQPVHNGPLSFSQQLAAANNFDQKCIQLDEAAASLPFYDDQWAA
ncbi:MAG: DUF4347 domain-containing protein [Rhodospirillaceae bacterium]